MYLFRTYLPTLLLFAFTLTMSSAKAQKKGETIVSGLVENRDGEQLNSVSIHFPQINYAISTDHKGEFKTKHLSDGSYIIKVSALGYAPYSKKILVHRSSRPLTIVLEKAVSEINEVNVMGKSDIQTVKETPFNVVTLNAKSHYNTNLSLAGLLNKASGVKIRENGGVGSDMNITLNGFTGRNVRVFLDGVPMQGMGSAFQLNNIPVNMAERIEIYKGVVPIEFGADALGGVINIVTNRTQNTTVDVSYSYGSFNTHKSNLSFNHTFKSGVSLQLNAFQNYSDNNYKVKTAYRIFAQNEVGSEEDLWAENASWSTDSLWFKRFHDKYRNETVVAKLGVVGKKWADRLLLGLTLGQEQKDIQHGSQMRYVFAERTAHNKSILPSLVYDKRDLFTKGLSVRLNANLNYEKSGSVDTSMYKYSWTGERQKLTDLRGMGTTYGEASFGISEYSNRNESATMHVGYRINNEHAIGVNNALSTYTRKPDISRITEQLYPEKPTAADSMDRTSFKNTLGVEYRYAFKRRWTTNIFAKHYLNRATGPQSLEDLSAYRRKENSSKLGYGIASTYFLGDIQLKASLEKSFRLPNDRELFGDELLEIGNIALKPEESNNYNLGFTLNKTLNPDYTLYVDWSGYYRDTYNFIQTTLGMIGDALNGASVYQRNNHGRVTRLGTDLEARVFYKNKATLGATISYADIRDKTHFLDQDSNRPNGNYGYRMPNLPYFFWHADATYYVHDLFAKGNTLNMSYTLNFVDKIYRNEIAYGSKETKDFIPKQLYSDISATYALQDGKYNISLEARNIENALLYDNFSLQKPTRSFAVKFRYFFIKRK